MAPPASNSVEAAQLPAHETRAALRRALIARAVAEAAHEVGPHRVTVSMVIARAGIHRQAFYQLFDNVKDALAYSWRASRLGLLAVVARATAEGAGWPERVAAVISALLERAESEPHLVELYLTYDQAALDDRGPFDDTVVSAIAGVLRPGRPGTGHPSPGPPSEELITFGILSVIAERLRRGEAASLTELAPELTLVATLPFTDRR